MIEDVEARALEGRLGYDFQDRSLLAIALTHRSFANEAGQEANYERMEFLGDSVLGLLAAEWLYRRYPELPEGRLSKLKSLLVSERVLSGLAADLGLGDLLRLGVGEDRSGGREKDSLLADSLESVIGAVFLDGGVEPVRRIVAPMLEHGLSRRGALAHVDAKTRLQEYAQAQSWELPVYELVAESGPDHEKRFTVDCSLRGEVIGSADGGTKKRAEQRAAAAALETLDEA